MAGIIINMSKVKQVLRLHAQGVSNRKIAGDLGLYKGTVNSYVRKIKEQESGIEELLAPDEPVLESKLFAGNPAYKQDRFEEFKGMIPYWEKELKNRMSRVIFSGRNTEKAMRMVTDTLSSVFI